MIVDVRFVDAIEDNVSPEIAASHPWITFHLDLRDTDRRLWEPLGEARAYLEVLAGMPLLPALQESLHTLYLAKGALATTAIEGNTLTEAQALAKVRGELRLPPSQEYLGREVQNVVDACNWLRGEVLRGAAPPLTPELIARMHAMVLAGDVPMAGGTVPGQYRGPGHDVVVSGVGYRGVPGRHVLRLMARLCAWLGGDDFVPPSDELTLPYAIIRAIVAHLYIAWIHPFGDGNGRTARLIEYYLLVSSGAPDVCANLLSDHYNRTRADYYRQLAEASRRSGRLGPFLSYAARGFADGLNEQLEAVKGQQSAMVFEAYVRDRLGQTSAARASRQRMLVLALATRWPDAVPVADVRYLTPEIGRLYEGTTAKTVTRDLNALAELELIVRPARDRVVANLGALAAYLPLTDRGRPTPS